MSDEDLEKIVVLLDEIRPELIAEGGDVKLAGFADGVVYVRLAGPFAARCLAKRTVLWDIERLLRMIFPWVERVETICPPPELEAR